LKDLGGCEAIASLHIEYDEQDQDNESRGKISSRAGNGFGMDSVLYGKSLVAGRS
jgi:hypothetical protein